MMIRYVLQSLRRRPAETTAVGVALAILVAFVAALGSFTNQTGARLTQVSTTRVPVDWQVQLAPTADIRAVERAIRAVPGFRAMAEVDYAHVAGLQSASATGLRSTGAAVVVTADPSYRSIAPSQFRQLLGGTGGAQLQQQTAANLSATLASRVTVIGSGVTVPVSGVVDLPNAGTFFQTVGAAPGTAAAAPPDNVLLLPRSQFAVASRAVPVVRQLHVQFDHAHLPSDPSAAADLIRQRADHLATVLVGQVLIGDNLEATLSSAREDAIYAQLLILLIALPAVLLAGAVATTVIALRNDRQRRDAALLRLRGVPPRRIALFYGAVAVLDGIVGAAVGALGAWLATDVLVRGTPVSVGWLITGSLIALALSVAVQLLPLARDRAEATTIADGMQDKASGRSPLPLRLGLDFILLAGSAVAFWLTARGNYQVVVVPEGVPVASVNYAGLIAPALAWPGLTLLVWRLTSLALKRRGRVPQRDDRGAMPDLRRDSLHRRRHLVSRGATGLALGLAVVVSAAIFTTTYDQQARVDVALTVGSDVAVTLPPDSTTSLDPAIARVAGTIAVEQVSHRLAYVGPDLQDLYAIDPTTIGRAAPLQDAFTPGSSVSTELAHLAKTPDGVLLSQETLHDYQLRAGDLIRLRLKSGNGSLIAVPFHVVGVITEFATAPRDSFIVANRSYVARMTGSTSVQTLLVRTDQPRQVAASIRAPGDAMVNDITAPRVAVPSASGLAASSLRGLARITLLFGILLAMTSAGLVLLVGAFARRRSLVTLGILGASFRQRASYVWSEARWVIGAGVVGGLAAGSIIALQLVKVLNGIFDPPPERPAIPVGMLTLTLILVSATALITTGVAARHAAKIDASRLRQL